jgi:hypothetical protein
MTDTSIDTSIIPPAPEAPTSSAPVLSGQLGFDPSIDPATLDAQTRTNIILAIRQKVSENKPVPDEELAFALRCVRLSRAEASRSRPSASGTLPKAAKEVKTVSLSDF